MPGSRPLVLILLAVLFAGCAVIEPREAAPPDRTAPLPVIDSGEPEAVPVMDASLSSLALSTGALDQIFQPGQTAYSSTLGFLVTRVEIVAATTDPRATLSIAGTPPVAGRGRASIDLASGTNRIPILVTSADGTARQEYELVIERQDLADFAQRAYVKASNTDSNDLFGYNVALAGDTLAVGAYLEDSFATGIGGNQGDNSADGSGAVYVFVRNGESWLQQAYIKASDAAVGHQFGRVIAVSGDTLAVGAPVEGGSGVRADNAGARVPDSGAVYVFHRRGGVWTQQARIKASNAGAGDLFGSSIALAGDILAVGAYLEDSAATGLDGNPADNSAENSGAVYVFTYRNGDWVQDAYLKPSNTHAGDRFGYSLALAGETLAVGAYLEASAATGIDGDQRDRSAPNSGAVYVFTRDAGRWSQQAYIKSRHTGENHLFGSSVALSGDTLAVGAHLEGIDPGGDVAERDAGNSGAVHVYVRHGGTWSQQAWLKASPWATGDRFGRSVALAGDSLAVGAYLEDGRATGINGDSAHRGHTDSGAVYLFRHNGKAWSQRAYIKASNTRPGDMFGYSVALSGDLLVVGAPMEGSGATGVDGDQADDRAPGSGAVYVLR